MASGPSGNGTQHPATFSHEHPSVFADGNLHIAADITVESDLGPEDVQIMSPTASDLESPGKETNVKRMKIDGVDPGQQQSAARSENRVKVAKPTGRQYTIRYRSFMEAPFHVHVAPIQPRTLVPMNLIKLAQKFKGHIQDSECWKAVNRRLIILEFSSAERANDFVDYVDLSDIFCASFIPPANVEVMGVLENIPTELSEEELSRMIIRTTSPGVQVNHVRRFRKAENGVFTDLSTCAIYFQANELPRGVFMEGNMYVSVREYKEKPTQCMKCLRFGHVQKFCRSTKVACGFCAGDHAKAECPKAKTSENPYCVLCRGPHAADSKQCPVYISERNKVRSNPFPNRFNRTSVQLGSRNPKSRQPRPQPSTQGFESPNPFSLFQEEEEEEAEREDYVESDGPTPAEQSAKTRFSSRTSLRKRSSQGTLQHRPVQGSSQDRNKATNSTQSMPNLGHAQRRHKQSYAETVRPERVRQMIYDRRSTMAGEDFDPQALGDQVNLVTAIVCSVMKTIMDEQAKLLRELIPILVKETLANVM